LGCRLIVPASLRFVCVAEATLCLAMLLNDGCRGLDKDRKQVSLSAI
jgi:hypothetical protein